MPFQFADRNQMIWMVFLALTLGLALSFGFQPTVNGLTEWLSPLCSKSYLCSLLRNLIGVVISLIFLLSLPSRKIPSPYKISPTRLFLMSILPLLASFVFGIFKTARELTWTEMAWYWAAGPVAEELLFRGWVYNFFNRTFKNTYLLSVPFLPVAVWGQAIAFSLWHIQNWGTLAESIVPIQIFYTFFVGLWLGFYRWQTGRLWPGFLAHALINFVADWKFWLVL